MEQRTLEWYRARLGRITGSQVENIMKSGRAKDEIFGATAKTYLYGLAGERSLNPMIIGDDALFEEYLDTVDVTSKAMRWGTENEPAARELYASLHASEGYKIAEVGSIPYGPLEDVFASSPDGVVADEDGEAVGCIEIKCPSVSKYAVYRFQVTDNATLKAVEPKYYWQCQSHMLVTETQWCDFVVYSPWFVEPIHEVRIYRDEADIATLKERIKLAENFIRECLGQEPLFQVEVSADAKPAKKGGKRHADKDGENADPAPTDEGSANA